MYVATADLRYLSRFDVNRGLPPPFSRRGGLGDISPAQRQMPAPTPYRELSSAPIKLVRQERDSGLAGLEGFFSTSKKWRKRWAAMQPDIAILNWWGYKWTREDEKFIRQIEFEVAKERAKRSGISRLAQDVAIPAMLTVMTAGAATPFVVGMAAAGGAANALVVRKAEKQMVEGAEKAFAINEDIIKTEHEVEDIQKEIAEMTKQMGVPKAAVNKAVQNAANQQEQQKKALTTLLLGGSALALTAMAA